VSQPFTLRLEGAGSFPTRGLPRVLWLGIADAKGALARQQKRLEDECAAERFAREERPFSPHLTLARIRAPYGAGELAKLHQENVFEAIEFTVADLIVLRSELGPGGSRYTEISRHALSFT
jgi:2'-5' RNA ligase